ncbi:Methyl-accepting chemotaxis protein III [Actinoplanes friuliensis DSM 7358]|uniref:Methyl-accepting chemotaxis protein III n=1 Tax=Actinoplanes friuliensis DSM 7358 TaxID=1246995 RepID=U5W0Q2_9ACTN|nr:Methyl-accepting chemotaxis protein III [Actinoplanes friuliensis DSM 7358]
MADPGVLRVLTDRRVGTKIMIAVAVIATFSVADGLYALTSLDRTNDQVKTVYGHSLELNTIGELRSAVNRTWLAADDYLLAATDAERASAATALKTAEDQVAQTTAQYRTFPIGAGETAAITSFQTKWAGYLSFVQDRLLPAAGDTQRLNAVRSGEQATQLTALRADMSTLSEETVASAAAQEASAETLYHSTRLWVLGVLLVSAVIGLVVAAGIARLIVGPLARCVRTLTSIGEGDLTARVEVTGRDEIAQLAGTLNHTAQAMADLVGKVTGSSHTLASASEQLSAVSLQLSASAEETSVQVTTVSESAGQVSHSVQAVAAGAEEMGLSIREIADNAGEAAGVAAGAARTAEATNTSVARLGKASTQIGDVIKLITAIAQQTNLLALNATIEAARAGEMGKGFAVVASEVKDLAQETAKATEDISAQVAAIQAESNGAVEAIREIAQVIATINDYTTTIASAVEEQTATTSEIARSVGHAAEGSSSIAETISGVAQAAQQVTSGATETQQTAAELARMAAELSTTVSAYRV